jgi:hypothetical protein
MNSIATVRELFVDYSLRRVFAFTLDGFTGLLNPQPLVLRTVYSKAGELEQAVSAYRAAMQASHPDLLLCFLNPSDDHRFRTAKVFKQSGNTLHRYRDASGEVREPYSTHYMATGGGQPWHEDFRKGREGMFLTGEYGPTNVWRVFRIDCDVFQSSIVTLTPLVITGGFPPLDLSSVADARRRTEIIGLYDELQSSVLNQTYRSVITKAKDIAEALLPLKASVSPGRTFSDTLQRVRKLIDSKQSDVPLLTYHICEKLRLLHQRTHPDRAYEQPVTPEVALAAAQDLVEVLKEWGYAR